MATLMDFIIAFLMSVLELAVTFADVALSDPLTTVSFFSGNVFILLAVDAFTYVALDAPDAEPSIIGTSSSSGRPP